MRTLPVVIAIVVFLVLASLLVMNPKIKSGWAKGIGYRSVRSRLTAGLGVLLGTFLMFISSFAGSTWLAVAGLVVGAMLMVGSFVISVRSYGS